MVGHLLVVGGSRSYPGAVVLAVRAALRSGAGLVTAFVPERLAPEYAARHPPCSTTAACRGAGCDAGRYRQARVQERSRATGTQTCG